MIRSLLFATVACALLFSSCGKNRDFEKVEGAELISGPCFFMEDGSGLSPMNGVTAEQFGDLLYAYRNETHYNPLFESLSIAGNVSDVGGLKSFLKGTSAANKVFAKSGYIQRVRAYTGYANTASGDQIAFALIVNNYACSNSEMKRKMGELVGSLPKQ